MLRKAFLFQGTPSALGVKLLANQEHQIKFDNPVELTNPNGL